MGGIGGPRFRRLTGRPELPGRLDIGRAALAVLDARLAGRDWLVGDGPSIADVSVFGYAHVAPDAGLEIPPHAAAWVARLRALPVRRRSRALRGERPGGGGPQHLRLRRGCGGRRLPQRWRATPTISTHAAAPARGSPAGPSGPARAPTSGPWGSTPRGSTGRSWASPRRGPRPCRATSPSASSPRGGGGGHAAGGVPLQFNTIAVSDNQSQATPGMRASLVSREVIADSIELMAHRARLRRARLHRRLRQDDAGGADGARAARQVPAVLLYSGPQRAGRLGDRELTILRSGRPSARTSAG